MDDLFRGAKEKPIKNNFDKVVKQINSVKKEWNNIKEQVPMYRQYAYFGGSIDPETTPSEEQTKKLLEKQKTKQQLTESEQVQFKKLEKLGKTKMKLPSPSSLYALGNKIKELDKTIKEFDKKPVATPAKRSAR